MGAVNYCKEILTIDWRGHIQVRYTDSVLNGLRGSYNHPVIKYSIIKFYTLIHI